MLTFRCYGKLKLHDDDAKPHAYKTLYIIEG
jgi:hypothetical protein